MIRRHLLALWAGFAVLLLGAGALAASGPVGADELASRGTSTSLAVQQVDATGADVVVTGSLVGGDPSKLAATVDGKAVQSTVRAGGDVPLDVVVVLDNAAVLGNATVQLAKQAIEPLLPGKGVSTRFGLVTTGGGASVEVGTTTSAAEAQAALDEIGPRGQSATWDGLVLAGNLLEDTPAGTERVVVLFSASPNGLSSASATRAQTALGQAHAQLDAVVMQRGADLEGINDMIDALGGTMVEAADEEQLDTAFSKVTEQLEGRFTLSYPAPSGTGRNADLTVTAGSASTTVEYGPGTVRSGSANLAPPAETSKGFLSSITSSSVFLLLVILLGVAAVIAFVWTVLTMVLPDGDNLNRRLQAYEDPYGEQSEEEVVGEDRDHATVPILKRAVDFTGEMAERRGMLERLEGDLERANLPLRAAEALFFAIAGGLLLGLLVLALTRNLFTTVLAVGVAIAVPWAMLRIRIRRRKKAFEAQLPDMLTLMAGTLRAGYSIGQGFESVSQEIEDPMGRELRRVVSESRLGRPLDEALDATAERMDSDDFGWAVMAIRIQREVGGNLAELLLTVANTMTQRERLRRDVATLTAEGRMSAIILGFLPPALGGVMYVMNPGYISVLFQPGLGYFLLGAGLVAMLIGFAWMKKIITIEV